MASNAQASAPDPWSEADTLAAWDEPSDGPAVLVIHVDLSAHARVRYWARRTRTDEHEAATDWAPL